MNISEQTLIAQYEDAKTTWPFIATIEKQYGLPYMLAFAIGSRETNLTNEVGDGGHGHGVWQLDDRSHTIPVGFDGNIPAQCITMAGMMGNLINHFNGNSRYALAAYNAGIGTVEYNLANKLDVDTGTAGNDYSVDTKERMFTLQSLYPETSDDMTPEESQMLKDVHTRLGAFDVVTFDITGGTTAESIRTVLNDIRSGIQQLLAKENTPGA